MKIMLGRRDGDPLLHIQAFGWYEPQAMCGAPLNEFALELGSPDDVTCEACIVDWVAIRLSHSPDP